MSFTEDLLSAGCLAKPFNHVNEFKTSEVKLTYQYLEQVLAHSRASINTSIITALTSFHSLFWAPLNQDQKSSLV